MAPIGGFASSPCLPPAAAVVLGAGVVGAGTGTSVGTGIGSGVGVGIGSGVGISVGGRV